MYLDYFSLNRHPFRITPDPSLFFPGGKDGRGVILNALVYGINSGEGILKVVGEVGSGKTMLCRMLEEELPDSVEIVYIANPSLSAQEILYAIAIELKLDVTASTERLKVLHLIQDYLLQKHSQGGTVVVFIEEAQSMPLETLEEIRLLSNLETHQHKLLQIVLFGQPELDKILSQKNIRQLRERITHSFSLEPLSVQTTSEYIEYRLKAAGCPRTGLFSSRSEKLITKASSGLTRRINILADKSLLAAYADSPSRQPPQDSDEPLVLPRHVKAAIKDSDYKTTGILPWLLGGLGMGALVLAAGIFVFQEIWTGSQEEAFFANNEFTGGQEEVAAGRVIREPESTRAADLIADAIETVPAPQPDTSSLGVSNDENLESMAESGNENTEANELQELAATPERSLPDSEFISETESESEAIVQQIPESQAPTQQESLQPELVTNIPEQTTSPDNIEIESAREAESVFAVNTEQPGDEETLVQEMPVQQVAVQEELDQEPASQDIEESMLLSPVAIVPSGLTELRMQPTADWLRSLESKSGYTIQLFSVPSTNPNGLEEYLQFLQLVSLLGDTYICFMPISSPNSGRWQVMLKEFEGVTPARRLINSLPAYVQQYGPYVRNLNGIQCSYPVETGN